MIRKGLIRARARVCVVVCVKGRIMTKKKDFCLNEGERKKKAKRMTEIEKEKEAKWIKLVIQRSHMVSGTRCPAGSDPVK